MSEIPEAIWSGSFQICGVEVKCHTLSNGQRIIEEESMWALLNGMVDSSFVTADGDQLERFNKWRLGQAGEGSG